MKHTKPFDTDVFHQVRKSKWVGKPLIFFEQLGSTNAYLKEQAANSAEISPGTLVFTDFQSSGRGRRGRQWLAPPKTALLTSVLLHPVFTPTWLPMIAGLAATDALNQVNSQLKWPNDIMIAGADNKWRKAGGILVEVQTAPNGKLIAVVGMGLNINIRPEALPEAVTPATSLLAELGYTVSRERLLARLVENLEKWVDLATLGQSPQPAWNERLITLNQPVSVGGNVAIQGIAESTDDWGRLLVRDAQGVLHTCAAGDVTLRGSQAA
ncbi:MAG: biotin--[acetyl-CoA-carboxylase] ligase [Candidatus Promineifilaceae bacterium]